ncbi:hypothetical protein EUGRSUZ_I00061 [Eucalyptus grandis]|uniref:Uncharacterized protein n=2 Tax=Eucalyptus grandis TaxID=71139 RepID=A0A059AK79_EUCGR|nr:hypothetical protein EUGRSUZ_I00061 [Eucalyptus grandis]
MGRSYVQLGRNGAKGPIDGLADLDDLPESRTGSLSHLSSSSSSISNQVRFLFIPFSVVMANSLASFAWTLPRRNMTAAAAVIPLPVRTRNYPPSLVTPEIFILSIP